MVSSEIHRFHKQSIFYQNRHKDNMSNKEEEYFTR